MQFRVREYRIRRKLTQAELAEKSGVSRTIISGLESGTNTVTTTETLSKIAEALNVKAKDLIKV